MLSRISAVARANPNDAVEEVAQQFEALFIQMMLVHARRLRIWAVWRDQLDTYQMADQQTALDMASKGFSLAEARCSYRELKIQSNRHQKSPR